MSEFTEPSLYHLPPIEGSIQGRFDGSRHPLLAELNATLDRHGAGHGDYAGTYFDPSVGGDPFYLSGDLIAGAYQLADAGEEELAVEVLDEGTRWADTQIHGVMYQGVALKAAGHGKHDLALAIALDNERLLAGKGPKHFLDVYQEDDVTYRMAEFAEKWLYGAAEIYEAVMQNGVNRDHPALLQLADKINLYTKVLEMKSGGAGFPKSEFRGTSNTNWLAVGIGYVCTKLYRAGADEAASQLEALDPDVSSYIKR